MKIILAAVLAGAVAATTNAQTVGEPREQRELRSLQQPVNTCKKFIEVGQACPGDGSCVDKAFCDSTTYKCVGLPVAGAKCGNGIFCAATLGCTSSDGSGVCRALPVAGQDCLWGQFGPRLCASGLRCYSEGTKNVCRNPTTVTTKACSVDLLCPAGQGCFIGGTSSSCVPSLGANAICAGNTPGICKSGLYCKSKPMTCVNLGANGANCKLDGSASCMSGLVCVPEWLGTVFRCRTPPIKEGASCVDRCGSIPATTTSPAVPLNCR
jgi:hypothetical protein